MNTCQKRLEDQQKRLQEKKKEILEKKRNGFVYIPVEQKKVDYDKKIKQQKQKEQKNMEQIQNQYDKDLKIIYFNQNTQGNIAQRWNPSARIINTVSVHQNQQNKVLENTFKTSLERLQAFQKQKSSKNIFTQKPAPYNPNKLQIQRQKQSPNLKQVQANQQKQQQKQKTDHLIQNKNEATFKRNPMSSIFGKPQSVEPNQQQQIQSQKNEKQRVKPFEAQKISLFSEKKAQIQSNQKSIHQQNLDTQMMRKQEMEKIQPKQNNSILREKKPFFKPYVPAPKFQQPMTFIQKKVEFSTPPSPIFSNFQLNPINNKNQTTFINNNKCNNSQNKIDHINLTVIPQQNISQSSQTNVNTNLTSSINQNTNNVFSNKNNDNSNNTLFSVNNNNTNTSLFNSSSINTISTLTVNNNNSDTSNKNILFNNPPNKTLFNNAPNINNTLFNNNPNNKLFNNAPNTNNTLFNNTPNTNNTLFSNGTTPSNNPNALFNMSNNAKPIIQNKGLFSNNTPFNNNPSQSSLFSSKNQQKSLFQFKKQVQNERPMNILPLNNNDESIRSQKLQVQIQRQIRTGPQCQILKQQLNIKSLSDNGQTNIFGNKNTINIFGNNNTNNGQNMFLKKLFSQGIDQQSKRGVEVDDEDEDEEGDQAEIINQQQDKGDPTQSIGNYQKYLKSEVLFREQCGKLKLFGNSFTDYQKNTLTLDNVKISLQIIPPSKSICVIVRLSNRNVSFVGNLIQPFTKAQSLKQKSVILNPLLRTDIPDIKQPKKLMTKLTIGFHEQSKAKEFIMLINNRKKNN